ncbi:MAG: translocation/assembly module TamB domain-containing protein [Armatimonadetes bacterium]|nr:translocation/assembly module TamB domain-containing protein [Armatimonadota bacterium]
MQNALHVCWRALFALTVALVGWAPVVLMAVLGGSYALRCLTVLTAPGAPVELSYETEYGTATMRAQSFSIDIKERELVLLNVEVFDPDGERSAGIARLEIVMDGSRALIRGHNADLLVNRWEDGSFDIDRLLPKSDERERDTTFTLVFDSIDIEYRDHTKAISRVVQAQIKRLHVDGAGDDLYAAWRLDADAVSDAEFRLEISDGRLKKIATRWGNDDVASLLPVINRFLDPAVLGEWANVTAFSLILDGSATLTFDDEGASLLASLQVHGDGISTSETLTDSSIKATVAAVGGDLRIVADGQMGGTSYDFDGQLQWSKGFRIAGRLSAEVPTVADLPPLIRSFVPRELDFTNASLDGWIDVHHGVLTLNGETNADSLTALGETVTDVVGSIAVSSERFGTEIDQAKWEGVPFRGSFSVEYATGAIAGFVIGDGGQLDRIAQRLGTDRVRGDFAANATITGTLAQPLIDLYVRGSSTVRLAEGDPPFSLGVFEGRAHIDGDGVTLDRLSMVGGNGVLTASGLMDWDDNLDFTLHGGGIDVNGLYDRLAGLAFVEGTVSGTRQDPLLEISAEVYGAEIFGRNIPQILAKIYVDRDQIWAYDTVARIGASRILASVGMDWTTHNLVGSLVGDGLLLQDWVGPEFVGSVQITGGVLSGSLEQPRLLASVSVPEALVYGVPFRDSRLQFDVDRYSAKLTSSVFGVGDGLFRSTGAFNFETSTATVKSEFESLPLGLAPVDIGVASLEGSVSGESSLTFSVGDRVDGESTLTVDDLTVNGQLVGSGSLKAVFEGHSVQASGQIGSIERYILLDPSVYDWKNRLLQASGSATRLSVQDLFKIVDKSVEGIPEVLRELADRTSGALSATVKVSGPVENLNVEIPSASLEALQVSGVSGGQVQASGSRDDGVWRIHQLTWSQGDEMDRTTFSGSGTIFPDGRFDVPEARLTNFKLAWLQQLIPSAPAMVGRIDDLTLTLSGTTDNPSGYATLTAHDLGYFSEKDAIDLPLSLRRVEIVIEDRKIELRHGRAFYQGVWATITGEVPFSAFEKDAIERQPINLLAEFDARKLSEIQQEVPALAAIQTDATVQGRLQLVGTRERLQSNLQIDLLSDEGGSAELLLNATLNDPLDVDGSLGSRIQLEGSADFNDFHVRFKLPKSVRAPSVRASSVAIQSGNLTIGGTASDPIIGGTVDLADLTVWLPSELPESAAEWPFELNPTLDGIAITAGSGSRFITRTAEIQFFGGGTLAGSMKSPRITIPLTVSGGEFNLPTAKIEIQSGGTINLLYSGSEIGSPLAQVVVNIEGTTYVVARRGEAEYERYDVLLNIQGNLLESGGLRITASSDPPDFDSEQLLAMLGQKDLIEGLALSGGRGGLRDLFSVGLPSVTSSLSGQLATGLKLDYLTIDYNPFDLAIAGAGKTLARGLMLHGRRQLSVPTTGRLKYELELTFRPPLHDKFFSRLRLGLATTQDVSWRIRLSWARRF